MIKWNALCVKCHDDQINVAEMGGASVMHENEKIAYRVLVGNLKARNHLEDLSTDLSIILKRLEEAVWEGVDLIPLAQDRDQ